MKTLIVSRMIVFTINSYYQLDRDSYGNKRLYNYLSAISTVILRIKTYE